MASWLLIASSALLAHDAKTTPYERVDGSALHGVPVAFSSQAVMFEANDGKLSWELLNRFGEPTQERLRTRKKHIPTGDCLVDLPGHASAVRCKIVGGGSGYRVVVHDGKYFRIRSSKKKLIPTKQPLLPDESQGDLDAAYARILNLNKNVGDEIVETYTVNVPYTEQMTGTRCVTKQVQEVYYVCRRRRLYRCYRTVEVQEMVPYTYEVTRTRQEERTRTRNVPGPEPDKTIFGRATVTLQNVPGPLGPTVERMRQFFLPSGMANPTYLAFPPIELNPDGEKDDEEILDTASDWHPVSGRVHRFFVDVIPTSKPDSTEQTIVITVYGVWADAAAAASNPSAAAKTYDYGSLRGTLQDEAQRLHDLFKM